MAAEKRLSLPAQTILLGSGMFGNVALSSLAPALPRIEAAFAGAHNVHYLTQLVVSAGGLGVLLISPLTGWFVRRFGRRAVVVGAYLVFLIAGTGGIAIPSLELLIASRFLTGGAGAVIVAMALILIGDHYTDRPRERRIGASHAIGAFLIGVVIQAAGFLANVDWRYAFLVHLTALPMLALAIMSPDLAPPGSEPVGGVKTAAGRKEAFPRAVWAIALVTLACGAIGYSVAIFTPFRLKDIGAYTPSIAGFLIVITVFTSVITSLLYGEIRRFLSPAVVFAVALLGWGSGLAITALATTLPVIFVSMAVVGLAGGLVGPNIFSVVSAITSDEVRPRAVGMVKGIYYFGPFFGPTMLQLLHLQKEPETALMSLAIFSAGMGVICLVVAGARRGRTADDPKVELNKALEAELEADKA